VGLLFSYITKNLSFYRRSQRQRLSLHPESQPIELPRPSRSLTTTITKANQIFPTGLIVSQASFVNSNSLSNQSSMPHDQLQPPNFVAQPKHHSSESVNRNHLKLYSF
jgi:hypothetical protein